MKRKVLAVLLSAAMAFSLTACGGGASDGESSKEASAQENANELTVWAWDKAFNIYSIEEAEKIYQKENPDFDLNVVEVSWEDMQTQLSTILSSGDYSQLPDILLMQDFAYQKYAMTYQDLFTDLTDSSLKEN